MNALKEKAKAAAGAVAAKASATSEVAGDASVEDDVIEDMTYPPGE